MIEYFAMFFLFVGVVVFLIALSLFDRFEIKIQEYYANKKYKKEKKNGKTKL